MRCTSEIQDGIKMKELPECLSRRYKALDELVRELDSYESSSKAASATNDPSIRLLCNFWDILKEDPNINLSQAVQQRMCANPKTCSLFGTRNINCYMAGCCKNVDDKKPQPLNKSKSGRSKPSRETSEKNVCCATQSNTSNAPVDELPLNKVLCNLKQAASFEKKCQQKVNDLLETQKQLQEQIQILEQREKNGIQLLKQADCMWSCMEESYKKKIGESLEKQKDLLKQLKDVEANNLKWRKNKKSLEFEMDHVSKCRQEIIENKNQKTNDIKCIDMEIEDLKKRIENNKKDLDVAKNSIGIKKDASNAKSAHLQNEITRLQKLLKEEQKCKMAKEEESDKYVKEAREDLQKLCKVLLQKKLESEDMKAEEEALLLEIELLQQNCNQCKDKCKNKQESINEEIKTLDKEIADFKVKCIRCHECTDTLDIRKFCTDCPRCVNERDCLYEDDHCTPDNLTECVCTTVKQKLLDNVFDNMYTVLERQIKSGPGKAVADVVLNCLKKSRNGKLNAETRKILQDFILTTVKKNLNLTIVGGAVKTRCEMDRETYKQLMLCLKQIKVTKPAKVDQGTESKRDPCERFGGTSECNCPKGPKDCICSKKVPPKSSDPATCPPAQSDDIEDAGQVVTCPYKESAACGPDCAMHELPDAVGSEVASWRPNPCQGPTCQFKNMRAAQCVLGQEALQTTFSSKKLMGEENLSSSPSTVPYVSCKDTKQLKAVNDKIYDTDNCKTAVDPLVTNKYLKVPPNDFTDDNPIMRKLLSGDIKIALNKSMVEEITNNIQEGKTVFVTLKTEFGKSVFSLQSNDEIYNGEKIFLPYKSPSGNIILKPYKSIPKKTFDNVNNKEPQKENVDMNKKEVEKYEFNHPNKSNLKKYSVSDMKDNKKECRHSKVNDIHEVKFKGINTPTEKETIFALKETSSDNFKIVLDKEFENYYKQAIKEYEGDNNVQYAEFLKSNSGHFIINFRENTNDNRNKALLIKTESGNIKVLVNKSKTDNLLNKQELISSNIIMTAKDLNELLNKSQSVSKKHWRQNSIHSLLPDIIKSFSDSNLYNKDKLKSLNQNNNNKELTGDKNFASKAITTSCNSQYYDNVCDKSKCACPNIRFKSNQWSWENSYDKNNNSQCGIAVTHEQHSSNSLTTSELMDHKRSDEYLTFIKTPPQHRNVRNNEQSESKPCGCSFNMAGKSKKDDFNLTTEDYFGTDQNREHLSIQIQSGTKSRWSALDNFPPQLPPFLKDFNYH